MSKRRGSPPPIARVTIKQITVERVELYHHVPPLERPIPVEFTPFHVEDSIPGEAEIEEEVKRLPFNRLGGPLGMWV